MSHTWAPDAFQAEWWTCLDTLGYLVDRTPELFGRFENIEELEAANLTHSFPPCLQNNPTHILRVYLSDGKLRAFEGRKELPDRYFRSNQIDTEIELKREEVMEIFPAIPLRDRWIDLAVGVEQVEGSFGNRLAEAQELISAACRLGCIAARDRKGRPVDPEAWRGARINMVTSDLFTQALDAIRAKNDPDNEPHSKAWPLFYVPSGCSAADSSNLNAGLSLPQELKLSGVRLNLHDFRSWLQSFIQGTESNNVVARATPVSKRPPVQAVRRAVEEYCKRDERPTQSRVVKAVQEQLPNATRRQIEESYKEWAEKQGTEIRRGRPRKN